jgi:hypothetical protein
LCPLGILYSIFWCRRCIRNPAPGCMGYAYAYPQGAMGVRCAIFHARIPIGIQVVANPPDLRFLILHLWKHCLSLGLIYYSIASSQPPSGYTVPLTLLKVQMLDLNPNPFMIYLRIRKVKIIILRNMVFKTMSSSSSK